MCTCTHTNAHTCMFWERKVYRPGVLRFNNMDMIMKSIKRYRKALPQGRKKIIFKCTLKCAISTYMYNVEI